MVTVLISIPVFLPCHFAAAVARYNSHRSRACREHGSKLNGFGYL
jgi:hypothetical protein